MARKTRAFSSSLHQGADQQTVRFSVHRLHRLLERVKLTRLRQTDVVREVDAQVLHDYAVARREEGENVRQVVALVVRQVLLPLLDVLREINLFGGPVRGLSLLIEPP